MAIALRQLVGRVKLGVDSQENFNIVLSCAEKNFKAVTVKLL